MRRRTLTLFLAAGLVLLQPGTVEPVPERVDVPAVQIDFCAPSDLLDCRFYEETLFRRAVAAAQPYEGEPPQLGIVPHHDVAGVLAASFFRTAAERQVDTVVLLGPNHSGRGADLAATQKGYNTPLGILHCDRETADRLLAVPGLTVHDELMQQDHAVQVLLPLVKKELPEARVVTLLLSNTAPGDSLAALAAALAELAQEKSCLIVGSIDFSHGLQPLESEARDAETAALIADGNLPALMQLGKEHLDAPAVLSVLLQLAQLRGRELTLLERADASGFVPPPWPEGVTGYLVYGG